MQAAHQRRLRSGSEYARYFRLDGLEKSDPILANGDTFETIRQMDKWIRHYQSDTAALAPTLRGATLRATCANDWEFAFRHFQYRLDKDGVEQLRRPLRSWADRKEGIDCDCYAILLSTILLNQGIPHKLRKTKYNNKPDFQHIYVIVPIPGSTNYITLDPVMDAFDKEAPFTGKHDHDMQIQGLNGIGCAPLTARAAVRGAVPVSATTLSGASGGARLPFGSEFLPLQNRLVRQMGLGSVALDASVAQSADMVDAQTINHLASVLDATPAEAKAYAAAVIDTSNEVLAALQAQLTNTRQQILATKEASLYPLADAIADVLAVWDDAPARDAAIAKYAATGTVPAEMQVGAIVAPEYRMPQARPLGGLFDSIGDFFSTVGGAVKQATGWVGQQATTAAHAVGQAGAWVGGGIAAGAVGAWSGVKQATGWVAQQAVIIGKLVLKYNPLSILIRAGLRVAFRVNLFYMSERLAIGFATDAQAKAAGLNEGEFRKTQDRLSSVQSMWHALQGDPDILRGDILYGNAHASNPAKIPGLAGITGHLSGLGEPATATTTVAASGFIATITTWLKSVDWKKLFATVSTTASVVNGLVSKYLKTPTPGNTYQTPLTEQEYAANKSKYDNPPQSSNTPLIIAGLGVTYLIFAH